MALTTIAITPGTGANVLVDAGATGKMQVIKLADSTAGSESLIPASATTGLLVNVSGVGGTVTVVNNGAAALLVDGSAHAQPVTDNSGSLTVDAGATAPVAVRLSTGAAFIDTIPVSIAAAVSVTGTVAVSGTVAVTQSGSWNIAAVTSITNTVTVTGNVGITGTPTVQGTVTGNQGSAAATAAAWPIKVTDATNTSALQSVGGIYCLPVKVLAQAGGGYSQQDKTAFTEGTTYVEVIGGVYNDAFSGSPAVGQVSVARITPFRALHANLRKQDGTELGIAATPLRTDPTGTTTQPVSGTVTANQGTANATPWNENLAQIATHSVVEAAAGVQKVGVSDATGTAFSAANPLPTQPTNARTPVRSYASATASQTNIALWTPAGGKKFVIESIIISVTGAGDLFVFDNSSAAANYVMVAGLPAAGNPIQISFPNGHPSSAANNVLRYTTGTGTACYITVLGYEV
jgi:hypothetical protein